jgi:hypothetical protein
MPLQLDHVFLCTDPGAPEAESLIRFGLVEGAPNRHPGQGTANRRFFFQNAFLELLWVEDPAESQSDAVRRTGLWDRWSNRALGASPFGVCLRPADSPLGQPPFPAWEYRPPYLPGPLAIHMATDSPSSTRPLLFFIAFGQPPTAHEPARRQPLAHPAGLRALTELVIASTDRDGAESAQSRAVEQQCPQVRFVYGNQHLVELGFDGRTQGRTADFRPELPLRFHW